jgi:bacterioferritin-associated ferredoxin
MEDIIDGLGVHDVLGVKVKCGKCLDIIENMKDDINEKN